MRWVKSGACLLALLVMLCSCAAEPARPQEPEADGWSYTFTDDSGAAVTLKKRPERVAVLFSSYAELWTAAGGTVSVTVGESVERGFVPEGTALVDEGAGKTVDLERLLAAQPDLVIGSADIAAQAEACRTAAEAGIPAALFRVDTFPDYLAALRICTDITGCEDAYAAHGTAVAEEIEGILRAVEAHRALQTERREILFVRAGSQASATKAKRAPENFVCVMLDELGARNIADDAAVLLDGLSLEEILLRDPDFIFISAMGSEAAARAYMEELFSRDGWGDLAAVKAGNYAFLEKELFHYKPNARWAEAYGRLAELLYPELKHNG